MRNTWGLHVLGCAFLLGLVGAGGAGGPAGCAAPPVQAQLVVGGLAAPLYATAPAGDPRIFVVERAGRIVIVEAGQILDTPFLDLRDRVNTEQEGGLLGIAFGPDYAESRRFYAYYTTCDPAAASGATCGSGATAGRFRSILSRFRTSSDPNRGEESSEEVLLDVAQPYRNHNGGTIAFGPRDGFLYLGLGDGGSANDPQENAQDLGSLLGKMLRLDVGPASGYAVPPSNPFAAVAGALPEIWALGLRNPFRFGFDRETGDLWIGDVGQNLWEEIDFEAAGGPGGSNFGWDVMEASRCNLTDPAPSPPCNDPSLILPVYEYSHDLPPCASVTGGTLYRGVIPEIRGRYIFADYCSGVFSSLDPSTGIADDITVALLGRTYFGTTSITEDGFGEMLFTNSSGSLYRIVSTLPDADADGAPDDADNCTNAANGPIARDPGGNVQLDSDGDGFGNLCDPDLDGDGVVNFSDLARMKADFFRTGGPADLDGNGVVNFADLARLKARFFGAPGPSGLRP